MGEGSTKRHSTQDSWSNLQPVYQEKQKRKGVLTNDTRCTKTCSRHRCHDDEALDLKNGSNVQSLDKYSYIEYKKKVT